MPDKELAIRLIKARDSGGLVTVTKQMEIFFWGLFCVHVKSVCVRCDVCDKICKFSNKKCKNFFRFVCCGGSVFKMHGI